MSHEAYDELVASSPQGSLFARSWWLDAVAGGRWRSHALEEDGVVVAAWPTVARATRWGDVHEGAPLTPWLGPLFRVGPDESELKRRANEVRRIDELVDALGRPAHVEARCHPGFDYWTPLSWHGFRQTTNYTWRLAVLDDLEAVFGSARENVRREVRKAEKRGVTVVEGSLEEFQRIHSETASHRGAETSRAALRRVEAAAGARNARTILLARDEEGAVHAGGYFVRDERWVYYLVGASRPELRTSGAPSLVLWKGIEHAAEHGLGFDFEGSMLQSVERFFRAFAGEPTPYSVVRTTPSRALRAARPFKRAARAALRSGPLRATLRRPDRSDRAHP